MKFYVYVMSAVLRDKEKLRRFSDLIFHNKPILQTFIRQTNEDLHLLSSCRCHKHHVEKATQIMPKIDKKE